MRLTLDRTPLAIVRLDPAAPIPAWATRGAYTSVTRTPTELSVVAEDAHVPPTARASRPYARLEVAGPIPFEEVGVLAALAGPLANAGVPIFAIATFDTDSVLVPMARVSDAVAALRAAGHEVVERT